MIIAVNGKEQDYPQGASLADVIRILKLEGRLAVEVNLAIIPRSAYASYILQAGDRVEIVHAIGGG